MKKIFNSKVIKEKRKTLRNYSTPQEIILWSRLRRSQLKYKFRRQHSIGKYIVDFYCPEKKIIIEIDGSQHKENNQRVYDAQRTKYFENLGIKIIRFWDNEVDNNLEGVVLKIEEYL